LILWEKFGTYNRQRIFLACGRAKGYVAKEESPSEVAEAIRTVMDGRIYVSKRVNRTILERLGHAGSDGAALWGGLAFRPFD
jgi:DNA-binding NarL/FixJ family response regulator